MLKLFKFTIKLILGFFIILIAIIGIPVGTPIWLPAVFGAGKGSSGEANTA
ncbi:MAG: hypothetical protein ACQ9MH_26340 [Nitrospinales bacterium]